MSFPNADPATITDFHAHIYYDPATTRDAAQRLRENVARRFPEGMRVGGWHDEMVGPHLRAVVRRPIHVPAQVVPEGAAV